MGRTRTRKQVPKANCNKSSAKKSAKKSSIKANVKKTRQPLPKQNSINKEPKCSICLDTTRCRKMKNLACSHEFHRMCIDKWLDSNDVCPLCREPTTPPVENEQIEEEQFSRSVLRIFIVY
ncbi:hypothetical protein CDAR_604671 [Caerostris darwini]|uniref:RING-type domain-containing protein n=1 Tax=Caerostris darwini TaxID=1538125 RepID=A0AAV4MSA1_9ARAC|nr:hypothetical protein CDAR_604671 [Caerostris darwini]